MLDTFVVRVSSDLRWSWHVLGGKLLQHFICDFRANSGMSCDDRGGTVVAVLNHTQHRARNLQSSQQRKHTVTIFAQVLLSSHPCGVQIMELSETRFQCGHSAADELDCQHIFLQRRSLSAWALPIRPMPSTRSATSPSQIPVKIEPQPNFFIKLIPYKTNSSITIEDCGIGVTKNELECNRQVWYQGFHGGHQCRGRHVHDRTRSVWFFLNK